MFDLFIFTYLDIWTVYWYVLLIGGVVALVLSDVRVLYLNVGEKGVRDYSWKREIDRPNM